MCELSSKKKVFSSLGVRILRNFMNNVLLSILSTGSYQDSRSFRKILMILRCARTKYSKTMRNLNTSIFL